MQIAEATVTSGNILSNQAMFKPINATGNSNIKISRDQAATPPIGGTFDIILENEKVTGNLHIIQYKVQQGCKKCLFCVGDLPGISEQ